MMVLSVQPFVQRGSSCQTCGGVQRVKLPLALLHPRQIGRSPGVQDAEESFIKGRSQLLLHPRASHRPCCPSSFSAPMASGHTLLCANAVRSREAERGFAAFEHGLQAD